MFQKHLSVCIHLWLTGCSYMAIGSVSMLKICNVFLALGSAFKSSFDCQVSRHMRDARPAHSAHRDGYMGGAMHHCYMDFLKARGVFSSPNKPAVGQYPQHHCTKLLLYRQIKTIASLCFTEVWAFQAMWAISCFLSSLWQTFRGMSCSGTVVRRDYSPSKIHLTTI